MTGDRSLRIRSGRIDLALRATGLALAAASVAAVKALLALAQADAAFRSEAMAYLLAATAFLCGCTGGGLLHLGAHIRDRVAIGPLWRSRPGRPPDADGAGADRSRLLRRQGSA